MAIDTASKRFSAMHVSSPWRSTIPFPDGTIDQGDRQHIFYLYSGILFTETVETVYPKITDKLNFLAIQYCYLNFVVTPYDKVDFDSPTDEMNWGR